MEARHGIIEIGSSIQGTKPSRMYCRISMRVVLHLALVVIHMQEKDSERKISEVPVRVRDSIDMNLTSGFENRPSGNFSQLSAGRKLQFVLNNTWPYLSVLIR